MSRTFEYYETVDKGAVVMYFATGLKEGKSYRLRISGVSDLAGNLVPASSPVLWTFSVGPDAYKYTTLDSLGSTWSPFKVPEAIGAGATLTMVNTPKLGGMSTNDGAARVDYRWDSAASHARVDVRVDSSAAIASLRWSPAGHILQAFCYGDGSGNEVRLAVRDSLPNGTVQRVLGPADTLSWVGWRLLEWNFDRDTLPYGQPGPSGIMRFDGFSLSPVPGMSAFGGQIGFDQIQLADKIISGVDAETPFLPLSFAFHQNYPNPFNPSTTITYTVPGSVGTRHVLSLKVFDLLGRCVATLVDGEETPGRKSVRFNAAGFASGIYYYSLRVDGTRQTRPMLLIR